jgi:hypothetical protein
MNISRRTAINLFPKSYLKLITLAIIPFRFNRALCKSSKMELMQPLTPYVLQMTGQRSEGDCSVVGKISKREAGKAFYVVPANPFKYRAYKR